MGKVSRVKGQRGKGSGLLLLEFSSASQRRLIFVLSIVTLFLSVPGFGQELQKWKDEKGQWHISDKPPSNLPAQPQAVPSLKGRGPSKSGEKDGRVGQTKTPSQAAGGLVYDQVICRNRLPTMSEAEAVVVNTSAKTLQFKARAEFFSSGNVLIEEVEGIYDYKLAPGEKEIVRVTLLRRSSLPEVRNCSLTLRSPAGSLRLK